MGNFACVSKERTNGDINAQDPMYHVDYYRSTPINFQEEESSEDTSIPCFPGQLMAKQPDGSSCPVIMPPKQVVARKAFSPKRRPRLGSAQSSKSSDLLVSRSLTPDLKSSESFKTRSSEFSDASDSSEKVQFSEISEQTAEQSCQISENEQDIPVHPTMYSFTKVVREYFPDIKRRSDITQEEIEDMTARIKRDPTFKEKKRKLIRTPIRHDAFLRNMIMLTKHCTCHHCEGATREFVCFALANAIFHHVIDDNEVNCVEFNSDDHTDMDAQITQCMWNLDYDHQLWRFDIVAHCFLLRVKRERGQLFCQLIHSWANTFPFDWWVGMEDENVERKMWKQEYWEAWRTKIGNAQWFLMEDFWDLFLKNPKKRIEPLQPMMSLCSRQQGERQRASSWHLKVFQSSLTSYIEGSYGEEGDRKEDNWEFDIPWLNRELFWTRIKSIEVGRVLPKFELPFC